LLLACDADLAEAARAGRCALCGGALHSACYPRKPRGRPCRLGPEHDRRFSFCCAVDSCRSRATPPSLRFLGRKVHLASSRGAASRCRTATDSETFDNHDKTRAQAPNPLPLPGLPTASENGNWEVRPRRQSRAAPLTLKCPAHKSIKLRDRAYCNHRNGLRTQDHRDAAFSGEGVGF
jgi:hypothetical protein